MRTAIALAAGCAVGAAAMLAWDHIGAAHSGVQPYAGQQVRQVSSLSEQDVSDLLAGQGWGLAKPAEFNGYPGPRHVLDAAATLGLTDGQRKDIQQAFDDMLARARQLGEAYVEAERALDEAFKSGAITADMLRERLEAAERLRSELREAHLEAHLKITPLLTDEQIRKYAELRGYGEHAGHAH